MGIVKLCESYIVSTDIIVGDLFTALKTNIENWYNDVTVTKAIGTGMISVLHISMDDTYAFEVVVNISDIVDGKIKIVNFTSKKYDTDMNMIGSYSEYIMPTSITKEYIDSKIAQLNGIQPKPVPVPVPVIPVVIKPKIKAEIHKHKTAKQHKGWYQYPTLDLLENHDTPNSDVSNTEVEKRKKQIVKTLQSYDINIVGIEATIGPTVTLYEIVPASGVRISKIKNLEDDIALSLSALGIRIIAPMPGRGTVGIEIPNQKPKTVSIKEALASPTFINSTFELPIVLGKTISNEIYVADLTKMPHLLIAGATGQGKSVCINTIIASILYKKSPEDVKFILVDPKKVELSLFKDIEHHFLPQIKGGAIITDTNRVVDMLNALCAEMDNRYALLEDAKVRNIKEYNKIKGNRLPYIILVMDEVADLMMTAGKKVEVPIARLAELARAIGIHLIIATQRPTVNIITGTIKANLLSRIAFKVTSNVDSHTILDVSGAEQLIGNGDMLYSTGTGLYRLQCPFIDKDEVISITEFIKKQPQPEAYVVSE